MSTKPSPFRITPAAPEALRAIESAAPEALKAHFNLIKSGLEAIPGVPAEAIYGAVTLRSLALKPAIFESLFLLEHHAVKHGELDRGTKELLAAVISWRNEGDETPTCAPYHEGAARFEGAHEEHIRLARDWDALAPTLDPKARDLIDFGLKVAFAPRDITDEDVRQVRGHGVSDAGLVELSAAALIAFHLSAFNQAFNLIEGAG